MKCKIMIALPRLPVDRWGYILYLHLPISILTVKLSQSFQCAVECVGYIFVMCFYTFVFLITFSTNSFTGVPVSMQSE